MDDTSKGKCLNVLNILFKAGKNAGRFLHAGFGRHDLTCWGRRADSGADFPPGIVRGMSI